MYEHEVIECGAGAVNRVCIYRNPKRNSRLDVATEFRDGPLSTNGFVGH
jgi:hypothetical protein